MALSIFSKFKKSSKEKQKNFLAVEISTETIKSALWTIQEGKTKIIKIGSLQEWDGANKNLLLTAVDASISNASEKSSVEPQGIIFGLPENWIKNNEIIEDKKEFLKFICQKLELKPLGFVSRLEALVAFLKSQEGIPVNAIFIELEEGQSLISLVQLGKIKGTHEVGRSPDLAADVKEGLARFGKLDNFPTRMFIFNGTFDLEEPKEQLVSFDWLEKMPFLHFPKVEILEVNRSIEAIAIAGGSEVAKSLGFIIEEKAKTTKKSETLVEKEPEPTLSIPATKTSQVAPENQVALEDLGFVQEKDIQQTKISTKEKETVLSKTETKKEVETEPEPKFAVHQSKISVSPLKIISWPFRVLKKIFFSLRLSILGGKIPFKGLIIIIIILALAGLGWWFLWLLPKATVSLYFTPQVVEDKIEVTLSEEVNEPNIEQKLLPAVQKSVTIEGEETTPATGQKLVGEKATGEATIFNKTDSAKNFPQGTVLIGPNNLAFTLDEEVTIASKSSETKETGEEIVYGKETAKITASSIGAEQNLASNTVLTLKNYPTNLFSAKTENGLSEGSSRQISVVSQEDLTLLLNNLKTDLGEKAQQQIKKDLNADMEVLDKEMVEEIINQEYSAEKNEEINDVSLKLKVKFIPFVYKKSDLITLASNSLRNLAAGDFIFDPQNTKVEVEAVKIEDKKATLTAKIQAFLLPKTNFEEIKKELVGHRLTEAEEVVSRLPNFAQAEIELKPNPFGLFKNLPKLSKNIIIEAKVSQ